MKTLRPPLLGTAVLAIGLDNKGESVLKRHNLTTAGVNPTDAKPEQDNEIIILNCTPIHHLRDDVHTEHIHELFEGSILPDELGQAA